MRKTILISLSTISVILAIFLIINPAKTQVSNESPVRFLFSKEADESFISSLGSNVNLNSGITMDSAISVVPEQVNNITFAVFNHTDEPILFPDQGFGLHIFKYDDTTHLWEKLQLQYTPYAEAAILPPKLETWNTDIHNSWDVLEDETTSFGSERLRLYISGKGQITKKIYSAYLDVPIDLSR